MQHEHENYADPPMQDWDGDEIMEDLEGLQLDDMTKQLASFRQPGQTLYQYVSFCVTGEKRAKQDGTGTPVWRLLSKHAAESPCMMMYESG